MFCGPFFLLGFLSLNVMFSVQCFVITCFKCVGVAQSYVFCVVFCDSLLVVGFVSLNLMFSV